MSSLRAVVTFATGQLLGASSIQRGDFYYSLNVYLCETNLAAMVCRLQGLSELVPFPMWNVPYDGFARNLLSSDIDEAAVLARADADWDILERSVFPSVRYTFPTEQIISSARTIENQKYALLIASHLVDNDFDGCLKALQSIENRGIEQRKFFVEKYPNLPASQHDLLIQTRNENDAKLIPNANYVPTTMLNTLKQVCKEGSLNLLKPLNITMQQSD